MCVRNSSSDWERERDLDCDWNIKFQISSLQGKGSERRIRLDSRISEINCKPTWYLRRELNRNGLKINRRCESNAKTCQIRSITQEMCFLVAH